jgi:cytoskeletal protein RodZ
MRTHKQNFGARLRQAREAAGVSLAEIADSTKLSLRNLSALECDRIEQLPGGIYRRAIVRAYAAHVGLDAEKTLRAFLSKYPDDVPSWADLLPPRGVPAVRRAMNAIATLITP